MPDRMHTHAVYTDNDQTGQSVETGYGQIMLEGRD